MLIAVIVLFYVGVFLIAMFTAVGLFFMEHIIICNSIVFGAAAGILSGVYLGLHPAFCLLIGLGILGLTLLIQQTTVGFWIFAIIMSIGWGFLFSAIAYAFIEDMIWFYVLWGLSTVFNVVLHIKARDI